MFLDKIGLLYELSLILAHDLMLVLMILYEQHSFFIIKIAYKFVEFVNFHSLM